MSFESPHTKEKEVTLFVFPNLKTEQDEILRTALQFANEEPIVFSEKFVEQARKSSVVPLTDDIWSRLENTDSYDIPKGDFEMVKYHAVEGNPTSPRDWEMLKSKIEKGEQVDAPIVCELGGKLHLVSGNTRLMVSRASGITPSVLLVRME